MIFIFHYIIVMYHTYSFVSVEAPLYLGCESCSVMVFDPFKHAAEFGFMYFVEFLHLCSSEILVWSLLVVFSCSFNISVIWWWWSNWVIP